MNFIVSQEHDQQKLDKLVAAALSVSRRQARLLISGGAVRVNERVVRILNKPIRAGARVLVDEQPRVVEKHHADPVSLLFVDRYLAVINKPPHLLSEADRFGSPSLQSVVPHLLHTTGEKKNETWLVHRLDAGTSGVLVMARTKSSTAYLNEAFRNGTVRKEYLALCVGDPGLKRVIDAPIAHAERVRQKVSADGKPAMTEVERLALGNNVSLVLARPRTGRTHQIRVHLAHVGCPLLGDRLYGGPGYLDAPQHWPIPRALLHAWKLSFSHPKTHEPLRFVAPVAPDFLRALELLNLPWPLREDRQSDRRSE